MNKVVGRFWLVAVLLVAVILLVVDNSTQAEVQDKTTVQFELVCVGGEIRGFGKAVVSAGDLLLQPVFSMNMIVNGVPQRPLIQYLADPITSLSYSVVYPQDGSEQKVWAIYELSAYGGRKVFAGKTILVSCHPRQTL